MSEQPHGAHADDHGHGHGHGSEFIQHHYDDAKHQFDSGKLGIWIFLAQEVLFFSALFVAYILYRSHHPEIYAYAHKYLDTKMGAINTGVLIASSLTAAWAVRAAQLRQQKLLIGCLAATILCAFGFLVIKYFEYTHKIHEHILFGKNFDPCVSSGGTPLINKGNSCPGTKSSVIYNFGTSKADEGCFGDLAIDTDPKAPFVQADCQVFEVSGSMQKGADGKAAFVEKGRKPIVDRCFDIALGRTGGLPASHAAGTAKHGAHAEKFPCWKPNFNPHVCKSAWWFNAKEGPQGPFADNAKCNSARTTKGAEATACSHSRSSGILVDYGDHALRDTSTTRIVAECKPPAPPTAVTDDGGLAQRPLELGAKAFTPSTKLTHHEEKEMLYAGPPPANTSMFFTIYFAMTGLHGIHVLVGIFVFIWLLIRAIKGHFTPDYFGPVDFAALYWHIVDLIWIFLFPLLYLIH